MHSPCLDYMHGIVNAGRLWFVLHSALVTEHLRMLWENHQDPRLSSTVLHERRDDCPAIRKTVTRTLLCPAVGRAALLIQHCGSIDPLKAAAHHTAWWLDHACPSMHSSFPASLEDWDGFSSSRPICKVSPRWCLTKAWEVPALLPTTLCGASGDSKGPDSDVPEPGGLREPAKSTNGTSPPPAAAAGKGGFCSSRLTCSKEVHSALWLDQSI